VTPLLSSVQEFAFRWQAMILLNPSAFHEEVFALLSNQQPEVAARNLRSI